MIRDLNVDHYQCEVFRYSPNYYAPSLASILFAEPFLLRRAACNFISSPFQSFHLRLWRRRILIGNLYRTTWFSHSSTFAFFFSFVPTFRPTGSLAEADMEMGDGPYQFRACSFCFCSAFHRGIGNAYFITLRCLAGRRLFAIPIVSVLRLLKLPLTHVFDTTILISHV